MASELNREAWLSELAAALRPTFKGFALDRIRVTCGWPSRNALGAKHRTVGQCFAPECSGDGSTEIFVSPLLDAPLEVAGTLAHELAHAAAGVKAGHGKKFVGVCRHVGLTCGEPRQVMPGPYLEEHLRGLTEGLGVYPHKALAPILKDKKPAAGGTAKLVCDAGCGMEVRCSKKLLAEHGPPTCSCGGKLAEDMGDGEGE